MSNKERKLWLAIGGLAVLQIVTLGATFALSGGSAPQPDDSVTSAIEDLSGRLNVLEEAPAAAQSSDATALAQRVEALEDAPGASPNSGDAVKRLVALAQRVETLEIRSLNVHDSPDTAPDSLSELKETVHNIFMKAMRVEGNHGTRLREIEVHLGFEPRNKEEIEMRDIDVMVAKQHADYFASLDDINSRLSNDSDARFEAREALKEAWEKKHSTDPPHDKFREPRYIRPIDEFWYDDE